jgi:hypothetical protein
MPQLWYELLSGKAGNSSTIKRAVLITAQNKEPKYGHCKLTLRPTVVLKRCIARPVITNVQLQPSLIEALCFTLSSARN